MLENGLKTVLCVGNGASPEASALAAAGFEVTVLDLSPVVIRFWERIGLRENASFRETLRPGGRLVCVAGNLLDLTLCPGPFDVVIERKTLHLFRGTKSGRRLKRWPEGSVRRGFS
jgi:hypothetical protein